MSNRLIQFDKASIDADGMIGVAKIAKALDVRPQTVYNWITKKKFRAYRIGTKTGKSRDNRPVRIRVKDFHRWLEINSTAI